MKIARKMASGRHRYLFLSTIGLVICTYFEQITCLPVDTNQWPTFSRRNVAALAREGYIRTSPNSYKRSISTLAKNGQLPTFHSPYDEADKQEQDDESHEKRNIASIARLRSYSAMKRNVQAMARDGYRPGRGHSSQNDKRNLASLARNGLLHKKEEPGEEYYYPFYQNQVPPLSEIDGPYDANEMYDYQQSINPDMFPPLSQIFKRSVGLERYYQDVEDNKEAYNSKRGVAGMPVHGLYRPVFADPNSRTKRYILSMPDVIDGNDIEEPNENEDKRSVDEDDDARDNYEKRHIGSLARLGLLPSFRFSGGRYSRSGRARLLLPSQEMYRKHSPDENFGIREYISGAEAESIDPDYSDIPSAPISPNSHPTGRILHRPLNNDLPTIPSPPIPPPPIPRNFIDAFTKNRWNVKEPKFYYFRSVKVPFRKPSGKRYLLMPAIDNILLRKGSRNSSLPSRRKNQ